MRSSRSSASWPEGSNRGPVPWLGGFAQPGSFVVTIVEQLRRIVGDSNVFVTAGDLAGYRADNGHRVDGGIVCVARPADTEQVSQVVSACALAKIPIVPRGGGTGFAGGSLPIEGQQVVVVSLERMRRIRSLDTVGDTVVADAGCTLHQVQQAALDAGRTLGLDHGGAGSSCIGGNIATNAGGNNVIRYGMAREQVLGLEAVFADGSIMSPPSVLRKSNAGYDLRDLLVGSEGTLALITAVALKLRMAPVASKTALLGLSSPQSAVDLLVSAKAMLGDSLVAFELMSRAALQFHLSHVGATREPLDEPTPWLVLLEAESTTRFMDLDAAIDALTEHAFADGLVRTGCVAASIAQRRALWALREGIAIAMDEARYPIVKTDTAVPIGEVPAFIERVTNDVERCVPGARPIFFGHVGDGNIHLNVLPPIAMPDKEFRQQFSTLAQLVEDIALSLGGTVSAEHGIGQAKLDALGRMLKPCEVSLMRGIKFAFDPADSFNPGKVIPPAPRLLQPTTGFQER
jgi:FAD/FMN-containing dehydrogenase